MKIVICGFPGVGKSTIFKNAEQYGLKRSHVHFDDYDKEYKITVPAGPEIPVFDSDSSKFDKTHFPGNYIKHIKETLASLDDVVILVSSHEAVREALDKEDINYILAYPQRELKEEYIQRYEKRGSSEGFIGMMENAWNKFIDSCEEDPTPLEVVLKEGQYLGDVIKNKKDIIDASIAGSENMNDGPEWFHNTLKKAIADNNSAGIIDWNQRLKNLKNRRKGTGPSDFTDDDQTTAIIIDVNAGDFVSTEQTLPTDNPEPSLLNTPESLDQSTETATTVKGGIVTDTEITQTTPVVDTELNPMVDPEFVEATQQTEEDRTNLIEYKYEMENDISKLEKVIEVASNETTRAGVEGLEDNGPLFTAAAEDINKRYGTSIEPTLAGMESFFDKLKEAFTNLTKKEKEIPTRQSLAQVKKYIYEAEKAFELYGSEKWQNEQKFINVGKVKLQVPELLESINSPGDINSILKLINNRAMDTVTKYCKNTEQRVSHAVKIFNSFKTKSPDTPVSEVNSLLPIKPEEMKGALTDSGLDNLNVNFKTVELPVLNKDKIKEVIDVVNSIIETSLFFIKKDESLINKSLSEDDFYNSKFWDKNIDSKQAGQVWSAGYYFDSIDEFSRVGTEYDKKMLNIAKLLEQWILSSVK